VGLNLPLNRVRGPLHPVLLRHEHLNQLAPSRKQRTECLRRLIGQGAWGWPHRLGKAGQDLCIDRICLSELAGGSGKIAYLPGVDHSDGNPCDGQRAGQRHF
jgi:hypothetical protein